MKINKIFVFILLMYINFNIHSWSISYVILSHNETEPLRNLLKFLGENKTTEDEIILIDDCSTNQETIKILNDASVKYGARYYQRALNFDFSAQRNYAHNFCNCDYIFFLDSDQMITISLMQNIKKIISSGADAYKIPIIIIIEGLFDLNLMLTNRARNWIISDEKIILYKNNNKIFWQRPIHETINDKNISSIEKLPSEEKYALIEQKTLSKTTNSVKFYDEFYKRWLINTLQSNDKKEIEFVLNESKQNTTNFFEILRDSNVVNLIDKNNLYHILSKFFNNKITNKLELINFLNSNSTIVKNNINNRDNRDLDQLFEKYKNNINQPLDNSNNTLLIVATQNENLDLVEKLLKNEANPLLKNLNGYTALDYANINYNNKIIELLSKFNLKAELAQIGFYYTENPNQIIDGDGNTILMYATKNYRYNLAKLLLYFGADPLIRNKKNQTAYDLSKYTNYCDLINLLHFRTTKALLNKEGFRFSNVVNLPINHLNQTYLFHAVLNNKTYLAKLLLEYGIDTSVKDIYGKIAFDYALYYYKILNKTEYKEIFELLNHEHNLEIQLYNSPNLLAILQHHCLTVDSLLKEINQYIDKKNGITILMYAANFGYYNLLKLLLNRGANPKIKTLSTAINAPANWTALDFAKSRGFSSIIELLKSKF